MGPVRTSRLAAHLINNPPTPAPASNKITKHSNLTLPTHSNDDSLAPIGVPLRRSSRPSTDSSASAFSPPSIKKSSKTTNTKSAFSPTIDRALPLFPSATATDNNKADKKKSTTKRKTKDREEQESERVESKNGLAVNEKNELADSKSTSRVDEPRDIIIEESVTAIAEEDEQDSRRGKRSRTAAAAPTKKAASASRGVAVGRICFDHILVRQ